MNKKLILNSNYHYDSYSLDFLFFFENFFRFFLVSPLIIFKNFNKVFSLVNLIKKKLKWFFYRNLKIKPNDYRKSFSASTREKEKKFDFLKIEKNVVNKKKEMTKTRDFNKKSFIFIKFLLHTHSEKIFFHPHHQYSLFFSKCWEDSAVIFNIDKFKKRWLEGESLIFNIYYFNFSPLLIGSFEFKNEILSLNWQQSKIEFDTWKNVYPLFIFKSVKFNDKFKHFFNKLLSQGLDFLLVSDAHYHIKTLFFLKSKSFTIALTSFNASPWCVDYPLPVFSTSLHSQYFFIKIVLFLEKNSLFFKYMLKKKTLTNFFFNSVA